MKKYNFDKDLEISHYYEMKFIKWLERHGMINIEQAPTNTLFEDWDIKTPNDTYEVKFDRWYLTTGNVLIETFSNKESGSLGWFNKTKADWLIVWYGENLFYGMPMEHLREMFFKKPEIWKRVEIDQGNYTTVCWVAHITNFSIVKHGDDRI